MLPMFFSFFPNRNRLNFRKRLLSSQNIASLIILEKQNCGFSRNSWGDRHLTIFRNQDKSPYLFNFHAYEAKKKMIWYQGIPSSLVAQGLVKPL